MSSHWVSDILELSRHLKQERLFTCAEKEQLHSLHSNIVDKSQKLYQLSWIARQQKNELDQLILASRDTTPAACCQRVNALEVVTFVDGYRLLTYHESRIGRFLKSCRELPKLVAACLVVTEKSGVEAMQKIARVVMSGLYGNVVLPEDELYVMQVLKQLIDIQVSQSPDPRRLLRRGSCAFSTVFKLLNEGHFSSRLFLTAALHKPVMQLLIEDEWFYDIDPERALYRFPPHERLRRFGQPGTGDHEGKILRYRDLTTDKLVALVSLFVASLQANMYCFPPSLAWIISQLYHTLVKAEAVERAEARAICADLVLTFFICPAVCDPEPYGITTDAPISYIARHNLMQVGQILQVLAISNMEEIDIKTRDLYTKFPPGCMSFLLDALLESPLVNAPPVQSMSESSGFGRSAALLSCSELTELTGFFQVVVGNLAEESPERKQMEELLTASNLPPQSVIQALCANHSSSHSTHNSPNTTPQATPPGTPVTSKKLSRGKEKKKLFLSPPGGNDAEDGDNIVPTEDVLVISFGVSNECPGMMSELKVLEQEVRQKKLKQNSLLPGDDDPVSESDILVHEKRTRFSLSHDQDSIATSDNLEAISEAASSHSVTSDLDNENDNLSDMMSANVSGRGTPNVSGRDTPISQVDSQMEGQEEHPQMVPDLPVTVQKSNREDVTDRFGKFDIKNELERDEAKSTVSDTWSTDVLASDSEPPEQNQLDRLEEVAEEAAHNVLGVQEVMEISETASDAWSTDVLASDTSERQADRLLELDQDDVASVSSRGVGPGSEIGELPGDATSDNTPQASGNQSPHGSSFEISESTESGPRSPKVAIRLTKDAIANANRSVVPPLSSSYRSYSSSSTSEQSIYRMARYIHDSSDEQLQTRRLSENSAPGKRGAENRSPVPLKFLDGKPASAEPPEMGGSEESDRGDREDDANAGFPPGDFAEPEAEESEDKDHKSPISKASSDVGLNCLESTSALDLSFHSSSSVGSLTDFSDRRTDSGVNSTATLGSSVSVDTLTNDFADGLKLTEHQNEKLDERRLSSISNPFFDPLMQDGAVGRQTVSTSDIPAYKSTTHVETGARPKTSSGCYPAPPKISVSQTSSGAQPGLSKGKGGLGVPNGKSQQAASGKVTRADVDHVEGGGAVSDSPAKSADASNTLVTPLRTLAKLPSVLVAVPSSADAACASPLSKDDDEKKQDKPIGDKRKPGFFHTFRERITRGPLPIAVQAARGSKRKVAKLADEVFRPSVIIDSDKGSESAVKVLLPEAGDDSPGRNKSAGAAGTSKTEDLATVTDTSDEILAKYRNKSLALPKPQVDGTSASAPSLSTAGSRAVEEEEGAPAYDPTNLETCKAFLDAKKKLRLVLSNADFQVSTHGYPYGGLSRTPFVEPKENELIAFLKLQLAEAINLQDKDLVAQLHETIRCLRQFDNQETKKLLKTMRDEYRGRSPYIAYLVRCRQGLLSSLALIERVLVRVERNKIVVNKYLLSVFGRLFLEKKEKALMKFISDFQKLTVSDEKTDLVENFLAYLHKEMEDDGLWQAASIAQLEEAKLYVERNVMSHVYTHSMFPNGDGDILRDQILSEHMKKLSKVITPSHKDLRIPKVYRYECPWPAAQTEIYMINAYKTPKDKLQCILRCSSTIMNLLSMANEKSVPAADDFMPVLIYVLIKANIPNLLSTVQYISSFYEKRLMGEELYWWMQFASAIEFIKTMDYAE